MQRYLAVIAMLLVLTGCASTKTVRIDQATAADMQGSTLVLTTSDRPDFGAMTAGKAMFAVVGALAMIAAGNEIVRKHDIEDPAVAIGQEVAEAIARQRAVAIVPPVLPGKEDDVADLASAHAGRDYVLDVRTINWSFGYFPTDWDNYRVMYSVKARLIDVAGTRVIAEAFCARVPDKTPTAPTYEQLLGNNAARLKEELRTAAEHCSRELQDKLL